MKSQQALGSHTDKDSIPALPLPSPMTPSSTTGEEVSIIQHHPLGKRMVYQVATDTAVFLEPVYMFQIWCVGETSGEVDLTERERRKTTDFRRAHQPGHFFFKLKRSDIIYRHISPNTCLVFSIFLKSLCPVLQEIQ